MAVGKEKTKLPTPCTRSRDSSRQLNGLESCTKKNELWQGEDETKLDCMPSRRKAHRAM